jgi:hypothetical protein
MTPEETTEKLRKYFHEWEWFVSSWGWKFSMNTCEGFDDMPEGADENTDAISFFNWPYLEGSVYFNLKRMAKKDNEEIESIVIHELCHFLVAPMQNSKSNTEITVTMIARTLKGLSDSQKAE